MLQQALKVLALQLRLGWQGSWHSTAAGSTPDICHNYWGFTRTGILSVVCNFTLNYIPLCRR